MSEKQNAWVKPAEGAEATQKSAPKPEPTPEAPKSSAPKPAVETKPKPKAKAKPKAAPKPKPRLDLNKSLREDRAGVIARQEAEQSAHDNMMASIREKLTDQEFAYMLQMAAPSKRRRKMGDDAKKFLSTKFTGK